MDPQRENCEDDIGNQGAQDAKYHDIGEVLEEAFASHIVARGKYNRRNAEIK